jgi:hypothetical protein
VTLAIEAPLLPVEDAVRVRVEETVALFDGETQDREGGVELDVDALNAANIMAYFWALLVVMAAVYEAVLETI